MAVSEVAIRYAAKGAERAATADRKVRRSIQRTGQVARKEQGKVNRWMQAHKTALLGIAAATAGAMAAIIKASPALSAELAGIRLGFSLLAMQIGNDVAPALSGLSDLAIDLAENYSALPDPIRNTASALIFFGGAALVAVIGLAALEGLLAGTAVASALGTIGSAAAGAATSVAAFIGIAGLIAIVITGAVIALGLLGSELLGITDKTAIAEASLYSLMGGFADIAFAIGGPLLVPILAAFALITGGVENAKRVWNEGWNEVLKTWARFSARMQLGFATFAQMVITGVRTMWATIKGGFAAGFEALDYTWREGWNGLLQTTANVSYGIANVAADAFNSVSQTFASAINSMIERAKQLPEVGDRLEGVSVQAREISPSTNVFRAADRMKVENEALGSRLRGVRDNMREEIDRIRQEGRANISEARQRAKEQIERFAPEPISMYSSEQRDQDVDRVKQFVDRARELLNGSGSGPTPSATPSAGTGTGPAPTPTTATGGGGQNITVILEPGAVTNGGGGTDRMNERRTGEEIARSVGEQLDARR